MFKEGQTHDVLKIQIDPNFPQFSWVQHPHVIAAAPKTIPGEQWAVLVYDFASEDWVSSIFLNQLLCHLSVSNLLLYLLDLICSDQRVSICGLTLSQVRPEY